MSSVVTVKELVQSPRSEGIVAQAFDRPKVEEQSDEYAIDVAGWVIAAPETAVAVELLASDRLLKTTPVDVVRPDVAALYPAIGGCPSGYRTRIGVLGLPRRCKLELKAVLSNGERAGLGSAVVEHALSQSSVSCRFNPLMVTSLGRMGTTWLMRLLAEHPSIVAHRTYPYESAVARYWAHQLRVLSAPADHLYSCTPDTFASDIWKVGHNPVYGEMVNGSPDLQRWLGRTYVDRFAQFVRETIDAFYTELAVLQDQERGGYFAEKFLPDHLPILMWDLYPNGREVILVRDIRDVVCSMLAFNAKRGNQSFGRDEAEDDIDFVHNLARDFQVLRDSLTERSDRVRLLHYEELILEPRRVLAGILEYLELDADTSVLDAMWDHANAEMVHLEAHRTSDGPLESIGRWRRDLDPELALACEESMSDLLVDLGYDECANRSRAG